jgi:hypothetical protein
VYYFRKAESFNFASHNHLSLPINFSKVDMLKIPSLVKTPRNRRFVFSPRYYNPDQEARQERLNKLNSAHNSGLSEADAIKKRIRDQYDRRRERKSFLSRGSGSFRIVLIIGALTLLTFIILK